MTKKERELRASIAELVERGDVIVGIDAAKRTSEQQAEFVEITNRIKFLTAELDGIIAMGKAKGRIGEGVAIQPQGRWSNAAEFFSAVKLAGQGRGVDERLIANANGNSSLSDADGAFAVDRDFLPKLTEAILQKSLFYSNTTKITISGESNSIRIPLGKRGYSADKDGNITAVYGGVSAARTAEGAKIALTKAKIGSLDLKLEKVTAMVAITEELMRDSTAMTSYIQQSAPVAIATVLDLEVLYGKGNGVTAPRGIFADDNKNIVKVKPKDNTKSITLEDINAMYSSLLPSLRGGAVWYVNPEIEGLLSNMTGANGMPVYLPMGNVSGKPFGLLKGLPVEPNEFMESTGKVGDILLANLSEYQTIEKGGVQMDMSIHVYFDTAETAFRFIVRNNGSPLYIDKYTSQGDKFNLASFVTLDTRGVTKKESA